VENLSEVKNYPFIQGKNLSLCAVNIDNIKLYASWDNNPEARKYARILFPKTPEEYKKYMEKSQEGVPREIGFELWHNEDKKPIGFVGFNFIHWPNRMGNIGLIIGEPAYWKKNLGFEATCLILEYAFNELNLNKVNADMYDVNVASWKICEKIGMKREVTLEKHVYVKGKYTNAYEYRIFKEEWDELRKKFDFK